MAGSRKWRARALRAFNGYRTFRPGSVSARKNMDVSAKSMDDSAKNDERVGQKTWTFRPNIFNSFTETNYDK